VEWERVHIYNINNGERFDTYVFKEERGSGVISVNGAAARRVAVGDMVIIVAFASVTHEETKGFRPAIVFPNGNNRIK
jgi:aspartate 1-decarboxylase